MEDELEIESKTEAREPREISLIGEMHRQATDIQFREKMKTEYVDEGVGLLMLEGWVADNPGERTYHLEDESLHYYATLIMNTIDLMAIQEGIPMVINGPGSPFAGLSEFITRIWENACEGASKAEAECSIVENASYRVMSDLAKILGLEERLNEHVRDETGETTLPEIDFEINDDFLKENAGALDAVFKKLAKKLSEKIKEAPEEDFSETIKQHPALTDAWIDAQFSDTHAARKAHHTSAVVDLRNIGFAGKITNLAKMFPDDEIFVVVGDDHVEGLKTELEKHDFPNKKIGISKRNEKWSLVDMQAPEEVVGGKIIALPALKIPHYSMVEEKTPSKSPDSKKEHSPQRAPSHSKSNIFQQQDVDVTDLDMAMSPFGQSCNTAKSMQPK